MKNSIKTAAFCAAIVFAMSVSALAKDNFQNRTAGTEISYLKILNASSANCLGEMGKMCDQAQATATATSQSAQTICGKDASSNDCTKALDNADRAARLALNTCLAEAVIMEIKESRNRTDKAADKTVAVIQTSEKKKSIRA